MLTSTSPTISILTPSYNQAPFLEQNIRSVLDQGYSHIEHIVIDGGSTDGTVDVLRRYPHLRWVSEPDGGQAAALNKGLAMATGEIVGWLNSDDYYEPNVVPSVLSAIARGSAEWCIGDVTDVYDLSGLLIRKPSRPITWDTLVRNPDIVRQPGTFFTRRILEQVGGWDADLFMVMDFDLWLRLARLHIPAMTNARTACFRIHGLQKSSRDNFRRQYLEMDRVLSRQGASPVLRKRLAVKKRYYLGKAHLKAALINMGLLNAKYETIPLSEVGAATRHRNPAI